ncbi:MAG: hypothetical protein ABIJ65_06170 [Chloroflexota bacterium]
MKTNQKGIHFLSIVLFFLGTILGMGLFGSIVLADLEAKFYFGGIKIAEEDLKTLHCPPIITPIDRSAVKATITNNTNRTIKPLYRMNVSNNSEITRLVETIPEIAPGETLQVEWVVNPEDAIYGNLILVKVMQYKTIKTPSREATCGTLVLKIPYLSGSQVLITGIFSSLVLMGLGIILWLKSNRPLIGRSLNVRNAMLFLVVLIGAGMIVACFGSWMLGIILLTICLLLIVASINFLVTPEKFNRI